MVKGISRQVIVVHSPDPALFEQVIFILKEKAVDEGITDDVLLKEAQKAIHGLPEEEKQKGWFYGPAWGLLGASVTAIVWCISTLL